MLEFFMMVAVIAFLYWLFKPRSGDANSPAPASRVRSPGILQTRIRRYRVQHGFGFAYKIEARGRMPIDEVMIRWKCRMMDLVTKEPILVDPSQEGDSVVYLSQSPGKYVSRGEFIDKWSTVASFPDETFLIAPYSGRRNVQVVLDLDCKDVLPVEGWRTVKEFPYSLSMDFKRPGYVEEKEKQSARVLTVKLAVGMALADGYIARAEGQVIQKWIRRHAPEFANDEEFRAFASKCNEAMREVDAQVRAGCFSLDSVGLGLFFASANPRWKYEAIELLYEIAAADGIAQEEETRMLRELSRILRLDPKEVERIRDRIYIKRKKPINGDPDDDPDDDPDPSSILDELGIPRNAPPEEIKKKLRAEFRKWSGRLNALPEGKEREYAQWMIDRIAAARKKYE